MASESSDFPEQAWSPVSTTETVLQASRLAVAMPDASTAVSFGGKSSKGIAIGQVSHQLSVHGE
jgi:hypothetical protein